MDKSYHDISLTAVIPTPRSIGLSAIDREALLEHLTVCMAIFDRQPTMLNASDIRLKSMIGVMITELERRRSLGDGNDGPPPLA